MRRTIAVCIAGLLVAAVAVAAGDVVSVIVKKTSIRRERQFYAAPVGEASYRDQLTVLAREKDWVKVGARGVEGWVHATAVTSKAVKAGSTAAGAGVSADDVALAGKGFNSAVEGEYRKKNPGANFAAVDRVEKLAVSEAAVGDFVRAGGLEPRGAGR
jgi:hypothetical protein